MSICAGVIIAIPFQQIDRAPDAEASAEGDDQRLEHLDSRIEKLHSKTRGLAARMAQTAGPAPASFHFNIMKAAVFSWASSGLVVGLVYLVHVVFLVSLELESAGHILFDVEGVLRVGVGEVFVVGMLRDVVLVAQEGSQAAELEDALAAVEGGEIVHAHELAPELLVVQAVRRLPAPALAGVVGVYGLFAQRLAQLLERARLRAAEEQAGIAVADDGVGVVLVERLELALCLQHQTGGDLAASYRRHELLKVRYLPYVRALVYEAAHMDGQAPAVNVVGCLTQKVKELGVDHAYEKVEGGIRVGHDEEQRGLAVSQRVQRQLVAGGHVAQLGDVEGGEPCAAAHEYALGGLARNELSRTF